MCNHLNVKTLTPNDIQGLPINQLLHLNSSKEWSGLTFQSQNQHFIIYNDKISPQRVESTIMHELSHIICKHHEETDATQNNSGLLLRNHNELHENEAEWLGACLQLPREGLLWALQNKMSLEEISEHFNSSLEMTKYRVNISGVKRQLSYRKKSC